jgi:NADH-quinone oxidoreductase subunit G/NADP-reducing hydrogenase subunit HndD
MINITINGKKVQSPEGITIMEAAKANNINIPNLCYLEGIHKFGSCRICVVEVKGAKSLLPSCMTEVSEGMEIYTHSEKVIKARRVLYELFLSDHNKECLSCKRSGSCSLQALGETLKVEKSRFEGSMLETEIDISPAITRDMSKCILCRRCVTACNEIQGVGVLNAQKRGFNTVISPAMELPLGDVNCIFCGQCTVVCPVGALKETDAVTKVWDALYDKSKRVVVQVAPAVRVTIGEEFGNPAGTQVTGKLAAALRLLGFKDVFDTNFAADLTIMEEGTELLSRLNGALKGEGAVLPMITSCSPGWIKYVEHTYPDSLGHLSTCKSPHTMLGALVKSYYAEKIKVDPRDMFVVSVMPCTAKKFEITRKEMENDGLRNVDAVLTTRELAAMIKEAGIDFNGLKDEQFDNPLGASTGAADIFGVTGGVMEAALRTVYELVTGKELPFEKLHVKPIVGFDRVKTADIKIEGALKGYEHLNGVTLKIAVTSGTKGANQIMEQVAKGESPYHFIEVMGCPGGCIMGGGQPRSEDKDVRQKRLKGIYSEDEGKILRKSHENPYIKAIYEEYLETPNGHISHKLLHTHYVRRGIYNELTDERFVIKAPKAKQEESATNITKKVYREENDAQRLAALEIENERLKSECRSAMETAELFKKVIADYTKEKQ